MAAISAVKPPRSAPPAARPGRARARRICISRGRLNSSPRLNIRNTTPNSARWRVSSFSSSSRERAARSRRRRADSRGAAAAAGCRNTTTTSTALASRIEDQFKSALVHVGGPELGTTRRGLRAGGGVWRYFSGRWRAGPGWSPEHARSPGRVGWRVSGSRARYPGDRSARRRRPRLAPRRTLPRRAADDPRLPGRVGGQRHRQVRARRAQDRVHLGEHRHAGVLRPPWRSEPRRPRHDHRPTT